MDRYEKSDFTKRYLECLISIQNMVSRLDYNILCGGVVFDNLRIDVGNMFYTYAYTKTDHYKAMQDEAEEIGSIIEYIKVRKTESFLREKEEPQFYIELPSSLYNVLNGFSDIEDKTQKKMEEKFDRFMSENNLEYDLTQWETNGILVYAKQ